MFVAKLCSILKLRVTEESSFCLLLPSVLTVLRQFIIAQLLVCVTMLYIFPLMSLFVLLGSYTVHHVVVGDEYFNSGGLFLCLLYILYS